MSASRSPALRDDAIVFVADLVAEVHDTLGDGQVPEARTEARDIVAAMMDEQRFWPSLNPHVPLGAAVIRRARAAATLRAAGAPFAYAVGRAAFRHLTLLVDERVLIPRQETELLVDLVLAHARGWDQDRATGVAADVGTGSGAIALALATEMRFARIIATDVSSDALEVARENARRLNNLLLTPVEFRAGNALAPLAGERLDVLVSNPPYIAFEELAALPSSVRDWEPPLALATSHEGLDVTAAIIRQAPDILVPGGLLALEVDVRRASLVADLAERGPGFSDVTVHLDLTGRERFVTAIRR